MIKATISELKNQLSAYLKKVRAGETVLIYDRNEPIARLEAIEAASVPDEHLNRLERAGVIRRGSGSFPPEIFRAPGPQVKHSVVEALIEERREGR
jgi:prevent-host-death family protein